MCSAFRDYFSFHWKLLCCIFLLFSCSTEETNTSKLKKEKVFDKIESRRTVSHDFLIHKEDLSQFIFQDDSLKITELLYKEATNHPNLLVEGLCLSIDFEKSNWIHFFLAKKVSPNSKINTINGVETCPLKQALITRNEKIIDQLLALDADPNIQLNQSLSPMVYAAGFCSAPIFQKLIDSHASLEKIGSPQGDYPIHIAAQEGRIANIKLILSQSKLLNVKNYLDESALFKAIRFHRKEVVQLLLKAQVDLNLKIGKTQGACELACLSKITPLHLAIYELANNEISKSQKDDALDIFQLILDEKPMINVENLANESPLHFALLTKDKTIIQSLFQQNIDPNFPESNPPLLLAAQMAYPAGIKMIQSKLGKIPEDLVNKALMRFIHHIEYQQTKKVTIKDQVEVLKLLIQSGAKPENAKDEQGKSFREVASGVTSEELKMEMQKLGVLSKK